MADFSLSSSTTDNLVGGATNDVFTGTVNQLAATDTVSGGAGNDILRLTTASASLDSTRLANVTGIDRLEFTGGGSYSLALSAAAVGQSDSDILTLGFGATALLLNVTDVGSAGQVKLDGTGLVTLRNFAHQTVTMVDGVNGNVLGGTFDDNIMGGTGADSFAGSAGDDNLTGGAGNDTLIGDDGNDALNGGAGTDSMSGGAGFDLLTLGTNDSASGGTGSDTFVIGNDATTITISDFSATDPQERIDLRAIAAATGLGTLTIANGSGLVTVSIGGRTISLTGLTAAQLSANNFVFAGQTAVETSAQRLSADVYFDAFTAGADAATGTSGNDVFESAGSLGNLTSADTISGGAGIDTFRIVSSSLEFDTAKMANYSSIERLDLAGGSTTVAGGVSLKVDGAAVTQAGGTLTVFGGSNAFQLDVSTVGSAGTVKMASFGMVTLRNFVNQSVTVDDSVNGKVTGGLQDDEIIGGAGNDSLAGAEGDDNLTGGAGNDTIAGDEGHDSIDGGLGADSLSGGAGYDLLVMGQTDTAAGGAGSDTFVIGADATSVTITDFTRSDPLERIDLRAIAAATSFSTLTIATAGANTNVSVGGKTIVVNGTAALDAGDFVFAGQTSLVTAAQGLSADPGYNLDVSNDTLTGTAGNDIFQVVGSIERLTSGDQINGGGGIDTLRIVGDELSLAASRMTGLNSIERLDLTASTPEVATGEIALGLSAGVVTQAGGTLTVVGGSNPFLLDISTVGAAGTVKMATFGLVTLRNFDNQVLTIDDSVDGNATGGNGADAIHGGAGNDSLAGAEDDDTLNGGSGNDSINGGTNEDSITGGTGNDLLAGAEQDDTITGNAGDDTLQGDAGRDTLISDGGNDVLTGGANSDNFVIAGTTGSTTISDFDVANLAERIDLRAFAGATSLAALNITDVAGNATFTVGGGHTVTLTGRTTASLTATEFIFNGQADVNTFHVAAGTAQSLIQQLVDEVPSGSTVILAAGTYTFDTRLTITRSDITFKGAGSALTIINSTIGDANASATIAVEGTELRTKVADVAVTGTKGATTLQLSTTEGLSVGDILYVAQQNDSAYFAASGNTGITLPAEATTQPDQYSLRELLARVTAINGNTVTLSHELPYTFEGGKAWAALDIPLRNVHLEGFQVVTTFPEADPFEFENTRDAWISIPTIDFDSVTESSISDVAIHNPGSHGFRFQRVFDIEGDNLFVEGAQNKGEEGNGYGYYFQEAFANKFTHLSDENMRHSVLFSSYSAEHYNEIQVDSTNRDINFHGSADADNIIIVDSLVASYSNTGQWQAVGPGTFPIHPKSEIDENTVQFKYLRSGDLDEELYAYATGADMDAGGGDDTVIGNVGADLLAGAEGTDLLKGGAGADTLEGGSENDTLLGEAGSDSLSGGAGQDSLDGGADADTVSGGDGHDMVVLAAGDTGTGGAGLDTFVINGTGLITLTDFEVGNTQERIDLRAIAGATSLATLTITNQSGNALITRGSTQVLLTGVAHTALTADNFVFEGQSFTTLAQSANAAAGFSLSSGADTITGTSGADIIEGSALQLTSADAVNGGNGTDTLRIIGSNGGIAQSSLDALTSVERLDVALVSGAISLQIGAAATTQSSTGIFTVFAGSSDVTLDSRTVADGKLFVETSGVITLRNFEGEVVSAGSAVQARIVGGTGADRINGNNQADSLAGGANADTIKGGAGNDTIDGGQGNDVMTGGTGSDLYIREFGDGSDTIVDFTPGAGGDVIRLHGYAVQTFAALTLTASGANTVISLGQDGQIVLQNVAPAQLTAANFIFAADGSAHDITASATDTFLLGSDGDDTITIGGSRVTQNLTVVGGAGNNVVTVPAGNFTGSTSTFGTYTNISTLDFSTAASLALTFNQAILAQAPGSALTLKIGATTAAALNVGTPTGGARLIVEGTGAVTLSNGVGHVLYASDATGVDFTGGALADKLFGGAQGDDLSGGAANDSLSGGGGNDTLEGGVGNDTMNGGAGNDTFIVDVNTDAVVEAANGGTDTVRTALALYGLGENVERLELLTASTTGIGNGLFNTLIGTTGNDTLDGKGAIDTMVGGLGDDTYVLDHVSDVITEAAGGGVDTIKASKGILMPDNVENLILTGTSNIGGTGNALNNDMTGNGMNNSFNGGAGNDSIKGGAGNDTMGGADGNDFLDGGVGNDSMVGGLGDDTYIVDSASDIVVEKAGEGTDTIRTSLASWTLGSTFEKLTLLGSSNSTGTGNTLSNGIEGNAGNNTLIGGQGDDTLNGAGGNDSLDGGTGADKLVGGAGDDTYNYGTLDRIEELENGGIDTVNSSININLGPTLENVNLIGTTATIANGNNLANVINGSVRADSLAGGAANDTISGGDGNDTINGGTGRDSLTGGAGNDVFRFGSLSDSTLAARDLITDFTNGGDRFDLSQIDANNAVVGDQAFAAVAAFTNTAGELMLSYNGGTNVTTLSVDVNGDSVADMAIELTGQVTSTTGWVM